VSAPILGLSEHGRRLSGFLISALEKGLSGRQILEILRRQGLGYRMTVFYQDLRILKGVVEVAEAMKYVPKDKVISDRLYVPANLKVPQRYITKFRVEVENVITGERKTTYFTIAHDVTLPRSVLEAMVEEAYESWITESPQFSVERIVSIMPVGGMKRLRP